MQDATFRLYNNVGYSAELLPRDISSFRIYENVGFHPTLNPASVASAYIHTGIEPLTPGNIGTAIAYLNSGVQPGTRRTITHYPRGWGVLPNGPQTYVVLNESAANTATAYENIT